MSENIQKILVAYSGGLDTSVLLTWLKDTYQAEVIAYCADVGQQEELDGLEDAVGVATFDVEAATERGADTEEHRIMAFA